MMSIPPRSEKRACGCARRHGEWREDLRELVAAYKSRHPSASPQRGRDGILAAARKRVTADVKRMGLEMLQREMGVLGSV